MGAISEMTTNKHQQLDEKWQVVFCHVIIADNLLVTIIVGGVLWSMHKVLRLKLWLEVVFVLSSQSIYGRIMYKRIAIESKFIYTISLTLYYITK